MSQTKVSKPSKSLKARQYVALQGMKAGKGAFGHLGLSSPALMQVTGTDKVFS